MAKRAKRVVKTIEMKQEEARRQWFAMANGVIESYAGFRPCPSCGRVEYLRGKRFDQQKCFECHVGLPIPQEVTV